MSEFLLFSLTLSSSSFFFFLSLLEICVRVKITGYICYSKCFYSLSLVRMSTALLHVTAGRGEFP